MGFELRIVGLNLSSAEYGGVDGDAGSSPAILLSGAICGLAGAIVVLGVNHRYIDALFTGSGWAWSGFTAAIVAGGNPVRSLIADVFLAGLEVGGAGMARTTDVPLQLVDVVQATIILVVAIRCRGAVRRPPGAARRRGGVMEALLGVLDVGLLASTIRLTSPILLASPRRAPVGAGRHLPRRPRGADARGRVPRRRRHVDDGRPMDRAWGSR